MQEKDYTIYDYIKPILTGSIVSILSTAVLLFIFSIVMTKVDIPFSLVSPISIILLGFSTFLGSFIGAKSFGKKGFFIGLCVSLTVFLTLLLLNLSMEPQGLGSIAAVKAVTTVITGVVGGVLGVNKRKTANFKI